MIISMVCIAFTVGWSPQNSVKPDALVQAEIARDRIRTARIELTWCDGNSEGTDAKPTRFYSWSYANGEMLNDYHGDQDQVRWRDESGTALPTRALGARRALLKNGAVWTYFEGDLHARVGDLSDLGTSCLLDVRRLGLNPLDLYDDLDRLRERVGYAPFTYSSEFADGQHVVTAHVKEDGSEIKWWIDPAKDWGITKTVVITNGRQIGEQRYELTQVDGVWIPTSMQSVPMGGDPNNTQPNRVIRVLHAEVNREWHPQSLQPSDIGIEPGLRLEYQNGKAPVADPVWDGQAVVSHADFRQKVESGVASYGPAITRLLARLKLIQSRDGIVMAQADGNRSLAKSREFESEWEKYTREFIQKYDLTTEQSQQAWRICRQCQDRGTEWVARKSSDFAAAEKLLSAPETRKRGELELHRLLDPIEQIFNDQFLPRLERIPTRAQRIAFENPSTKPASPSDKSK